MFFFYVVLTLDSGWSSKHKMPQLPVVVFFFWFFLSVTSPGMSVSMTILRQASTTFFTSVPVTPVEANKKPFFRSCVVCEYVCGRVAAWVKALRKMFWGPTTCQLFVLQSSQLCLSHNNSGYVSKIKMSSSLSCA